MCPVIILSDGYIANGSEPWRIPKMVELPKIVMKHPEGADPDEPFMPYARDEYLARPWAIPGTPGLNIVLAVWRKKMALATSAMIPTITNT